MKRIYRYMKCQFVGTWRAMFATFAIGSWQLAAICSILMATTACTDDVNVNGGIIATDGETGITLYLPDIEGAAEFGATRVDDPVDQKTIEVGTGEAALNDMYLLVFDKSNGSRKIFPLYTEDQDNADYKPNSSNGYKAYTIPIDEGTYKFYLLANLDEYLEGKVAGLSNEDKVLEAVLNFAEKVPGTLKPGNLPMACLASQMKNAPGAVEGSASEVTIVAGKNNAVYADMYFLCSKVRYTILFDQGSFSKDFTSTDVDFTDAEAINVRKETALVPTFPVEATYEDKVTGLELSGVEYPDTETGYIDGSGNLKERDEDNIPANFKPKDWSSVDGATQKAWQGTVYLPANPNESKPTTLNFYAEGSQMKGDNEPYSLPLYWNHANDSEEAHGLDRSNFYDIIIKLTNPTAQELEKQDVTLTVLPWDVNEIVYSLHGTYWLEIEDSRMAKVVSGEWSQPFGFDCNDEVSEEITFESPIIYYNNEEIPFYEIKLVNTYTKDDYGNLYELDPKWKYYLRVRVNTDLPYTEVIKAINTGGGYEQPGKEKVTKENINYFHIRSGNIHKRIEIENLSLNPYLIVTPLELTIDVREKYTSGINSESQLFDFLANFDNSEDGVEFTLNDHDGLLALGEQGKENGALVLSVNNDVLKRRGETDIYDVLKAREALKLAISGLTGGKTYWSRSHEYRLTFTLKMSSGLNESRTINIFVKPFSTTYTIHFRDNTKTWEQPHIYVYQLLTLPTDLTEYPYPHPKYNKDNRHPWAGKLIGFVEDNESERMQWNGAVRYVFTNNLSFKGWYGYGGPPENDPYITWESSNHSEYDLQNYHYGTYNGKDTKGFLMFGEPEDCPYPDKHNDHDSHYQWNYDFAYTETADKDFKKKRYNYDINLNADHEAGVGAWSCEYCKQLYYDYKSDYNFESEPNNNWNKWGNEEGTLYNTRFYPGIAMEKDEGELGEQGWWKYTLSGVAEPGRTVMFFTNLHLPWEGEGKNYGTEDNRFPGDYEAGIPLFDFADNEGWFQFNGNATDRDQHFEDDMPTEVILNKFDEDMASKLRLEILKANSGNVTKITIGHYKKYQGGSQYTWKYEYVDDIQSYNTFESVNNKYIINLNNNPGLVNSEYLIARVYCNGDNDNYKEYQIPPKFFRLSTSSGKYVTRQPLLLEYNTEVKLFVKWNDHITISDTWDEEYSYYNDQVEKGGNNYLNLYQGKENKFITYYSWNENTESEISNYKFKEEVTIPVFDITTNRDVLTLKLGNSSNSGEKYKYLRVEDLPKYYIPAGKTYNYLINWHMLKREGY